MGVHVKTKGFDNVLDELQALETKTQRKYARKSLRAGAKVIQNDARDNAKAMDIASDPYRLWKRIATRAIPQRVVKRQGYDAGVAVGVKTAEDGKANVAPTGSTYDWDPVTQRLYDTYGDYYYSVFLEFGRSDMAAQPYLRPAIENNEDEALQAISDSLNESLSDHARGR